MGIGNMDIYIDGFLPTIVRDELRRSFLGDFLFTPKKKKKTHGANNRNTQIEQQAPDSSETSASSGDQRFQPSIEEELNRLEFIAENRHYGDRTTRCRSDRRHCAERNTTQSLVRTSRHASMTAWEVASVDSFEEFAEEVDNTSRSDVDFSTTSSSKGDDITTDGTEDWNIRDNFLLPDDFPSRSSHISASERSSIKRRLQRPPVRTSQLSVSEHTGSERRKSGSERRRSTNAVNTI